LNQSGQSLFLIFALIFLVLPLGAIEINPDHLDQSKIEALLTMYDSQGNIKNLSKQEQDYTHYVQHQVLSDILTLYSSNATKITYSHFSMGSRGLDGADGFHVVKRLDLDMKTILVNERWPFENDRIALPDEIRIRTRVFGHAQRGKPGAEKDYVVMRYRLGWKSGDTPVIYEEPAYDYGNKPIQRRAHQNVFNCKECHRSESQFAKRFSSAGIPIDPEVIVQPSAFSKPLFESIGYQEFSSYLKDGNYPEDYLKAVENSLVVNYRASTQVPGLIKAIQEKMESREYMSLGGDSQVFNFNPSGLFSWPFGVYYDSGIYWKDSIEEMMESNLGRFVWWIDNNQLIPSREDIK